MKTIINKIFEDIVEQGLGQIIENLIFEKCVFRYCDFSRTLDTNLMTRVNNIILKNIKLENCMIGAGYVENTIIENLSSNELLQCWGTLFNNVVLKGKMSRIMFTNIIDPSEPKGEIQQSYNQLFRTYYESVDMALDISEAHFKECNLRGIPARCIKRDSDSQVVITREKALELKKDWNQIDFRKIYFKTSIQLFLDRGDADYVLVAPKLDKRFTDFKIVIDELREKGFVY
ncbi:MAG: hypothetical protein MUE81_21390 [Thermoflexibacter sp.]|jgi:hypothetical protein|nr:hypothetical protein [Thermoflexibacter sp.]